MYYKLYIRGNVDGSYTGPYTYKDFKEAKNRVANGEYLIIKHDEETDSDEIVEHGNIIGKQRKDHER